MTALPLWRNGRRTGLADRRLRGLVGSSPTRGTFTRQQPRHGVHTEYRISMPSKPKTPVKSAGRKRGPPEPPPLVIDVADPLEAFDRLLRADPKAAKAAAQKPRRGQ